MNKKQGQNRVTILEQHVQSQLQRQQTMKNYYQKVLRETQKRKQTLTNMNSNQPQSTNYQIVNNESFMMKSNMSMTFDLSARKNETKKQKTQQSSPTKTKKQSVTFQAEYQSCAEQVSKVISAIRQKERGSQLKKQFQKTNKTTSSVIFTKTSKVSPQSTLKRSSLAKQKQLKTESSCPQVPKKQKILSDIGDILCLNCQDEVVNTLIANIKKQEEEYVDLVLKNTEKTVRQKMKNYISRQTEKYEQMLFKRKQQEKESLLSSLKSNRETVKCGYTQRMKEIVDRGLRSRGFSQI